MSGKRGAPATHSRVQGMLQTLGGKITDAGLHLIDDFARLEEGVEDVLDGEDYFGIDEDESTGEWGIDEDESRHHIHVFVLFDHVMPCDSTLSLSLSLFTLQPFSLFLALANFKIDLNLDAKLKKMRGGVTVEPGAKRRGSEWANTKLWAISQLLRMYCNKRAHCT